MCRKSLSVSNSAVQSEEGIQGQFDLGFVLQVESPLPQIIHRTVVFVVPFQISFMIKVSHAKLVLFTGQLGDSVLMLGWCG